MEWGINPAGKLINAHLNRPLLPEGPAPQQPVVVDHRSVLPAVAADMMPDEELANLSSGKPRDRYELVVRCIEKVRTEIVRNNFGLCVTASGVLWLFNGAYWWPVTREEVMAFLWWAAEHLGINPRWAEYHRTQKDLLQQLCATSFLPAPVRKREEVLINFRNGTVEITPESPRLRPFQREDFLRHQLDFDFQPGAAAPRFQKFLDRVLPNATYQLILAEFFGSVFLTAQTLRLEKCLFVYGPGGTGKSTLCEIISAVLGAEHVSAYSLQALTDPNGFCRARLQDKLLNFSSEISRKLHSDIFKKLVSAEKVEARLPHGPPFLLENPAKLCFNCNELPTAPELTEAYFRRLIIVPFMVRIPESERNPELARQILAAERPGIFNWLLQGLQRLLRQKGFTPSDEADALIQQYKKESDPFLLFLDHAGWVPDLNHEIRLILLCDEYRGFCAVSGYRYSQKDFCKRVRERFVVPKRRSFGHVVCAVKKTL